LTKLVQIIPWEKKYGKTSKKESSQEETSSRGRPGQKSQKKTNATKLFWFFAK
jgi:ribosomal protein L15